jgi:TDG/mug DNA glycosylase family protein
LIFNRDDLAHFAGFGVPDLIGDHCRLLIVGINPGLWTAAASVHFAHPTNRFWPAMLRAGLIEFQPGIVPLAPSVPVAGPDHPGQPYVELRARMSEMHPGASLVDWGADIAVGMTAEERTRLEGAGIGITNLVARATARASDLGTAELRTGRERLDQVVAEVRPVVAAVAGLTAYRTAFERPGAFLGRQPETIGSTHLWVVPNPSGLNAHETMDSLAAWYRRAAEDAGLP